MLLKAFSSFCLSVHLAAFPFVFAQEKALSQEEEPIIIEVRDETDRKTAIGNALFGVYDEQGKKRQTCRSNQKGELQLSSLAYGRYRLRLLSAVPGYKMPKEDLFFSISQKAYHMQIFLEKKERVFHGQEDYLAAVFAVLAFLMLLFLLGYGYVFYIEEEKESEE